MKLRIYSDLHLDHYDNLGLPLWTPPMLPSDNDTMLILAGDLWTGTKFIENNGHSWIKQVGARFKKVLIVLGNHDYWEDLTILAGAEKCNQLLCELGIYNTIVLDQSTYKVDDYIFIGCTLWSNMSNGSPLTKLDYPSMMHHDSRIKFDHRHKYHANNWCITHRRHKEFILKELDENSSKQIIVISHHLPLPQLSDPMYNNDPSNAYFSSDLSDIIIDNDIKLWCFGHSHHVVDEYFEGTRMINNSLGYVMENKNNLVNDGVIIL